jgi:hypothetical protein
MSNDPGAIATIVLAIILVAISPYVLGAIMVAYLELVRWLQR